MSRFESMAVCEYEKVFPDVEPIDKLAWDVISILDSEQNTYEELGEPFLRLATDDIDNEIVIQAIKDSARKHTPSDSWEAMRDGSVGVGCYTTKARFYTSYMHEVAHLVVNVLEKKGLLDAPENEEDFCWDFSELACNTLNLPYDHRAEELNRNFYDKLQTASDEEISQIISLERQINGYSELYGDTFYWSSEDNTPIIRLKR